MSMISPKLGYFRQAGATAGVLVSDGPSGLYGVICTATGGTVTVYDGTSTGGTPLFSKTMAAGEVVPVCGSWGIAAKAGLFLVVSAGDFNVIYT
jgi:hypothetical protein